MPQEPSAPRVLPLASDDEKPEIGRRAVLQSMLGASAGLAWTGLAEAHPVHNHLANQQRTRAAAKKAAAPAYSPIFLDAHQLETLTRIAERIVPGSTKAASAPFLDQLLAVETAATQSGFLSSLGAFDMQAMEKFNKPWKALSAAEQDELLTIASTAEPGRMPGMGGDPRAQATAAGKSTIRDHFDNLKTWISGAYYSSEMGMQELGWTGNLFFEKPIGCDHPDGHA